MTTRPAMRPDLVWAMVKQEGGSRDGQNVGWCLLQKPAVKPFQPIAWTLDCGAGDKSAWCVWRRRRGKSVEDLYRDGAFVGVYPSRPAAETAALACAEAEAVIGYVQK